jgi:hypothetical protein
MKRKKGIRLSVNKPERKTRLFLYVIKARAEIELTAIPHPTERDSLDALIPLRRESFHPWGSSDRTYSCSSNGDINRIGKISFNVDMDTKASIDRRFVRLCGGSGLTSTWTYRERSRCSSHHADPLRQQGPGRGRPPQPWLLRRGLDKAGLMKERRRRQ